MTGRAPKSAEPLEAPESTTGLLGGHHLRKSPDPAEIGSPEPDSGDPAEIMPENTFSGPRLTREELLAGMETWLEDHNAQERDPLMDVPPGEVDLLTFLKLRVAGIEGWETEVERVEAYATLRAAEGVLKEQPSLNAIKSRAAFSARRKAAFDRAKAYLEAQREPVWGRALPLVLDVLSEADEKLVNTKNGRKELKDHHKKLF